MPPEGVIKTGLIVDVVDNASEPSKKIGVSIDGLIDRLTSMIKRGTGAFKKVFTSPLGAAEKGIGSFKKTLIALGTSIGAFLFFRKMKRSIESIFEEAVKLETQLLAIANATGSAQFAEQTLGWARRFAKELRVPREDLFAIAQGLQEIGVNAAQIDPSGIIAAGQAVGGVSQVISAIQEAALDPNALLGLQERFRQLPFGELQEIIATVEAGDFEGKVQALNALFSKTFGDNIERSRNSVAGLRQGLREMILTFQEAIVGVGSPLFDFFRDQLDKAVKFIEDNQRNIREIGASISSILTTALRAFLDFLDFVLEKFGLGLDDISDKGTKFRRKFLIPATAEIIGLITRIEVFAEVAFDKVTGIFQKFSDPETVAKATALAGFGAIILGILLRRPTLLIGGATLLGISGKFGAADDSANAAAGIFDPINIMAGISSGLKAVLSNPAMITDLSMAIGMILITVPGMQIPGAILLAGGLAAKGSIRIGEVLANVGVGAEAREAATAHIENFTRSIQAQQNNRATALDLADRGFFSGARQIASSTQLGPLFGKQLEDRIVAAIARGLSEQDINVTITTPDRNLQEATDTRVDALREQRDLLRLEREGIGQ